MREGFEEKYRECSLGNERCKNIVVVVSRYAS